MLSNRQRIWLEHYLTTWNASEAARVAGYRFPQQSGSENLSNPVIKAEIRRRLSEHHMTAEEVLMRLAAIARGEGDGEKLPTFTEQIRALELVGKAHQVFTERVRIDDWRSEAIAAIREGGLSYADLESLFDPSLARELFALAGVPIAGK